MGRRADPRKAAAWERRLRRFVEGGLSAAEFCQREGVSVSSFQYWQRKLRDAAADHGGPSLPPPAMARFDPVEVVSRQAVTIRFGGGTVMEIPEDRVDLVCAAIEALAGEREPC